MKIVIEAQQLEYSGSKFAISFTCIPFAKYAMNTRINLFHSFITMPCRILQEDIAGIPKDIAYIKYENTELFI